MRLHKGLLTIVILTLSILPMDVRADLPSPPRRLHRIGFEVFGKLLGNADLSNPSGEDSNKAAPLTEEEEKELQKQIAELKELLAGKDKLDLGNGKVVKYEDLVLELRKNYRKLKVSGDKERNNDGNFEDGWKYPQQVTAAERTVINAKIASVKDELQVRFDSEYAEMDAAGKLKRIGLPVAERDYRRERLKREIAERNALTVVSSILQGDEQLRTCCEGVPIEWLARDMKCPEPSIDDASVKDAFRNWSVRRMPRGLNGEEQNVVFDWQFIVVEKEKRPWRDLVIGKKDASEVGIRVIRGDFGFQNRRGQGMTASAPTKGFEDFEQDKVNAADFVETWYKKAVAAGMSPAKEDEEILARAHASKKQWGGNPNVTIERDSWRRRIKIHGTVSSQELTDARTALLGGLGMVGWSDFSLELHEPVGTTLNDALTVFSKDAVKALVIRGGDEEGLVLSNLPKTCCAHALELYNCKVAKVGCLSEWRKLESFTAKDCDLGDLTLLSGCTALTEVKLEGCAFTGLKSLWAAENLRELSVANSKECVDLSVVGKLDKIMELDISGCSVTNFTALKAHPSLHKLRMEHVKGGVNSLSILLENPELRKVDYLKEDFAPSAHVEFARRIRQRECGDDHESLLQGAVKDRDLQEVRRLCEIDVKSDDALSDFAFASEQDEEMFRILVPKASERALTSQLKKLMADFGYGYSFKKSAFVPSNRVELVSLLLKHGARPDDAVEKMAHPAETDLDLFRILIEKASEKVLTKLLQAKVKSFGNNAAGDRESTRPADRLTVVKLLLKNGADVNARNFFGKTSLVNAIAYDGDMELVRVLLDNGADVSSLYPEMEVFREFYQGHEQLWGTNRYELVELLFAHKFDANSKGRFGRTPLGELVFFGGHRNGYDLKMAEILLKHGADPNLKQDKDLGSAIDMAYRSADAKELVDLFAKYGGVVSEETKKKVEESRNDRRERPSGRRGDQGGNGDRLREEMDRFHEEMRKCTDPEEHRKIIEDHHKRMREIHESR